MEDVVVSKEATNFTSQNRKSQGTRLVSINSISLKDITVGSLRKFCTRIGLKGTRKLPKMLIGNLIADSKISGSYIELQKQAEEELKTNRSLRIPL